MSRNPVGTFILLSVISFMLVSCVLSARPSPVEEPKALLWPAAPQSPRIEWVKEIRGPEDYGIAKGFWQRLAEKISGIQERSILKPYGVLADQRGRLIVVDSGSSVVHILDPESNEYRVLGAEQGFRFTAPIGVAEDDQENLYVTDSAAGIIYRYSFTDRSIIEFTSFSLKRPTGIAFSSRQQSLFVSDTMAHQVVVFNLSGQELYRIGNRGAGDAQFNYPTDLFVDQAGQLYVTDALNQRIQILTPEGQLITKFGEGGDTTGYFAKPKGVAVDSQGHIYVCDALLDAVQIFDSSGKLLLFFGGTGSQPGEFWMPTGIHIDKNNYIYVADSFNHRVQVFKYRGDKEQNVRTDRHD